MEKTHTGQPGETTNWQGPDAILQLHGRLHVCEHLLMQLLHEGLKDSARKGLVAKAMQHLEDELHRRIPLAHGDGKRVCEHALQSLNEITTTLMLNIFDGGNKPV